MNITTVSTPPSSPVSSLCSDRRSEPPESPGAGACQALLPDELTVCGGRARGRGRYCAEHGREYKTLTRAYKEASEVVLVLDKLVLPRRTDVLTLHDVPSVDDAVVATERYLDAIEVEIEGRRTHHRRFFQTKDDGHEHWLKNLQTKKAAASAFLERLRGRKRDLVMAKEAVRQFQESLRRIELAVLEEQRNKRSVHPYGFGGQGSRVDWNESAASYSSVAAGSRAPVRPPPFRRVDPWATIDLEGQRRAAGWQAAPPYEGPGGASDSGSCGAIFWIVVGWMLLCIWFG
ncbi:hypothetical protein GSI_14496 [Ganoderma sinense ZZ0214-1]|uniref:Uncharacterized protein n=1 Tax=Ganoderma sinense ZZ0214-1 TaxID=1077348 RepID=A0A2G8RNV8_9APHY|nr:hypothetical protein GSI_14496 [Ganoderma sinense ZZ0214-1]